MFIDVSERLLPHDAPLERLKALHPKLIDLSLDRMLRVCEALGNPQDRLPPIVHVAGTNGKGSTVATLRAMAEAQGLRVHVYSSPHLVRFAERIRLSGTLISNEYLSQCLEAIEAANNGQALTFFEATTAAAFLAFAQAPADLLLLEVGLGGIMDATNIISKSALSLITPIDYDHQEFLGPDLTTIAKQKAGIIKSGTPVFTGRQSEEAMAVISRQALKLSAPLKALGQDFDAYVERDALVFQDEDALYDLNLPALLGPHQIDNAALALKAASHLGFLPKAMDAGLREVTWPARLQRLKSGPLYDALPIMSELWLDGGHNPHAARALRLHLDALQARNPSPLFVICGLLSNKDASGFFEAFQGLEAQFTCVPFAAPSAASPAQLAAIAQEKGLKAATALSPLSAIMSLSTPSRVLICGSLYLAGEVLALSPETWPQ
jgi:dihydrofolate synthase / folylpolyglutamate synthase